MVATVTLLDGQHADSVCYDIIMWVGLFISLIGYSFHSRIEHAHVGYTTQEMTDSSITVHIIHLI